MSSAQLVEIEENLKLLAEQLATLNLEQNEILVNTEKANEMIEQVRARIEKKRKLVDQENSDKLLMEERLLATERKSQQLKAKIATEKHNKQRQTQKTEAPMPLSEQPKPKPPPETHDQTPKVGPSVGRPAEEEDFYNNASKGEYQPPLLFTDCPTKPQQPTKPDEEDEDDILARIRRNVGDE